MEQQLPAGLGEGQIAEFVEDDEVEAGEIVGEASLAAGAAFGLEPIDEIDGGEEAAARPGADAASRDGDRRCVLPVPVPPTSTTLRCWAMKAPPARSRTRASLIGVSLNAKSVDVLGQRQLGDGELVLDRARLLLRDLGLEQIADEALRFMLAFERGGERLVVGAPSSHRA